MKTSILTIAAAAIAVTAIGFTTPASSATLGAAGQPMAQSLDNPIVEVGRRGGGKRHGKHWGGGKRHGKHFGHKRYRAYHGHYSPYNYGGCFKQAQVLVGGYYVWQTVNICY